MNKDVDELEAMTCDLERCIGDDGSGLEDVLRSFTTLWMRMDSDPIAMREYPIWREALRTLFTERKMRFEPNLIHAEKMIEGSAEITEQFLESSISCLLQPEVAL